MNQEQRKMAGVHVWDALKSVGSVPQHWALDDRTKLLLGDRIQGIIYSLKSQDTKGKQVLRVGEPEYGDKGQKSGQYRADLLPTVALLEIASLLREGAERHKDIDPTNPKWKQTPVREHINRSMVHLMGFLAGDTQEDHLTHAACRLLFALSCKLEDRA